MTAGGTLVAMTIAAHAQRPLDVTDAFRLGDATAPERASSPAAPGAAHAAGVSGPVAAGVLLASRRS